jgi:hypothetical protein
MGGATCELLYLERLRFENRVTRNVWCLRMMLTGNRNALPIPRLPLRLRLRSRSWAYTAADFAMPLSRSRLTNF